MDSNSIEYGQYYKCSCTGRAMVRGISQLQNKSTTDHYEENWAGTLHVTNPHSTLTGFTLFGTGGNASFGRFTVFGIERA